MSTYYEDLVASIGEAIEDAEAQEKKLSRRVVTIMPVKEYHSEQIKKIRNSTGMSQKLFASYLGVSNKTVEAWERGINQPSGAASRMLHMMEMDGNLVNEFPFVQITN